MQNLEKNEIFEMAVQFVNNTNRNIFLTGKAGSGKTTFLKFIQQHSHKKLAVVAPTGVAAINAGGVTIHSLFQLPLGNFLPELNHREDVKGNFYSRNNLLKNLKISSEKRTLIQELDLLIIDEVSMVRADLLDAIDVVLKWVRKQPYNAFGGVQMLFIGDLFQLPPVVQSQEWMILQEYYEGPFFFHAKSLQNNPPLYIELKKIYRQSDVDFIQLLNNIRNNTVREEDLKLLNNYYNPSFKSSIRDEYIVLTSHNYKADHINQNELESLKSTLYSFNAEVSGDFNEKSCPTDKVLYLKEGARIMFVKNDKGEAKRYYNGKIGTIKKIEEEKIFVIFPDNGDELLVEKETWENIRYIYNKEEDLIEEEVTGTFTQFPIRLAWAITIHKSQGLTFNKAIIDAGKSFAAGQVYVALSRLTSLEGLVLHSRINAFCINTDKQAVEFTKTELETADLEVHLKQSQKQYIHNFILQGFDWEKIAEAFNNFSLNLEQQKSPLQEEAKALANHFADKIKEQKTFSERFRNQLIKLLPQAEEDHYQQITERIEAAEVFFNNALHKDISLPLQSHFDKIKNLSKAKKYQKMLKELSNIIKNKKQKLQQIVRILAGLQQGKDPIILLQESIDEKKQLLSSGVKETQEAIQPKLPKGSSQKHSLKLFKEGQSVKEIAIERSLAISTIEGHLLSFLETGELDIKEFISENKICKIRNVFEEMGEECTVSIAKEILGEDFSFNEIRAVSMFLKRINELSENKDSNISTSIK